MQISADSPYKPVMKNRPTAAFCYDFDGTLAPGYMQDHAFIPKLGVSSTEFWREVKETAKKQKGDQIHAYMHLMLRRARGADLKLSRTMWKKRGADLPLFPGVKEWFKRQNDRARDLEINLEHYIVSSGVREMIEGSPIASEFKRIYASSFLYTADGVADGVALGVNYTNKTQYMFRVNKGTLEEWDDNKINKATAPGKRRIPFSSMAFFGDGETDVPCMRLVTDQGGYAVAVYVEGDPKSETAALQLQADGRAKFAGTADYSEGGDLDALAGAILTEIAARAHSTNFSKWPAKGKRG